VALPDHRIGIASVLILEGSETPKRHAYVIQDTSRPGMDGADFTRLGKRSAPFRWVTWRDHYTHAEAIAFDAACKATIGTIITIREQLGPLSGVVDWPNTLVLGAESKIDRIYMSTGFLYAMGFSNFSVVTSWTLQLIDTAI